MPRGSSRAWAAPAPGPRAWPGWPGALAPERRGELLGIALGAAVGGALFGPVIGAVADQVGTGPAFSAAGGGRRRAHGGRLPGAQPPPTRRRRDCVRPWPRSATGRSASGMWLTTLAGLAFGVLDVLAPLRLSRLGASALLIGATFLAAAAIEAALSPLAGRLSDRRGALLPVRSRSSGPSRSACSRR